MNKLQTIQAPLELCPITVDKDYAKKWRIENYQDFLILARNGVPLRNTLYRKGGLNFNLNLKTDKYFQLLKYTEAHYSKDIMKMSKSKDSRYLESKWVILNDSGEELFEQDNTLDYIHLFHPQSPIFTYKRKYRNVETGEIICEGYNTSISSKNFIFIEDQFNNDKSKRGVIKLHKFTGNWELIQ